MKLEEIFTLQNIIIYFIVINLLTFFVMWLDKRKAKKRKMENTRKHAFTICITRWWNRWNSRYVYISP